LLLEHAYGAGGVTTFCPSPDVIVTIDVMMWVIVS
jgi:hypothetical protein